MRPGANAFWAVIGRKKLCRSNKQSRPREFARDFAERVDAFRFKGLQMRSSEREAAKPRSPEGRVRAEDGGVSESAKYICLVIVL